MGPGGSSLLRLREVAQSDEPEDVGLDLSLSHLLPDRRIRACSPITSQRDQLRDSLLEPRGLGQATALETEDRHRDLPPVARLADHIAVLDHRS